MSFDAPCWAAIVMGILGASATTLLVFAATI